MTVKRITVKYLYRFKCNGSSFRLELLARREIVRLRKLKKTGSSSLLMIIFACQVVESSLPQWCQRQKQCAYQKSRSYHSVEFQTSPIYVPLKMLKCLSFHMDFDRYVEPKFGSKKPHDINLEGWLAKVWKLEMFCLYVNKILSPFLCIGTLWSTRPLMRLSVKWVRHKFLLK